MGLQEQSVVVKFAGGIETKMDSKAVPSARLLALENGVFTRAVSIKKRNGYTGLSQAIDGSVSTTSGGKSLGARGDELLEFTVNRCYSHQGGVDQWTDSGAVFSVSGTDRAAVHTGTQQTAPDCATSGGVTVFAWEDSRGGVYYTVVDAASGSIYRTEAELDENGTRPRCCAVGNVLHVYWVNASELHCAIVNPVHPTAAVTTTIVVTDLDAANIAYDVVPTARASNPAAFVWKDNAILGGFRVGYIDQSGALGSPATGHPSAIRSTDAPSVPLMAGDAIGLAYNFWADEGDDFIAVAYLSVDGLGVKSRIASFYSGGSGAAVPIANVTAVVLGTSAAVGSNIIRVTCAWQGGRSLVDDVVPLWCAFEDYVGGAEGSSPSEHIVYVNWGDTARNVGTERVLRSVGIAAHAFQAGATTDVFCTFVHDTTYFNTYVTLRLSDFAPAARILAGSGAGLPTRHCVPSTVVTNSIAAFCLPYRTRLASANGDKFGETGLRLITLDFDDADAHQTAQLGAGLYMAGACPMHYDGHAWTEQSFHFGPEKISAVQSTAAGQLTLLGAYEYHVWYEWTDYQGEVHRGPESVGFNITLTGTNQTVTLTLPTLRVTQKSNVRICVSRSRANDATEFFRVTSLDPTAGVAYVVNDPTVDAASFLDVIPDTTLATLEPDYTTGGILSNDPTSLGSIVVAGKNRLFFTDMSNGKNVRYSQQLADGFGVEITPELVIPVDPFGGDVTALAVMDDNVVIFKEGAIFALNGDGPLPNGSTATSGFSPAKLVTSDVGCSAPSSIALTPEGLMFKSAKGIYLLDRGFSVSYAGSPVEAYNAQSVRAATVLPDRSQVVFLTDSGKTLLYDFLFKQWSTFTNHEGRDGIVVNSTYHYLRTDDRVFRETVGSYSDAGVRITLRLETAWLHMLEHLQGLQRFWGLVLLGTYASPHQLGVQYRSNFDETWSDPEWLDATGGTSSAGWITGGGVATVGIDPITGTSYGDGPFGDGPYGGTGNDVYQWRVGLHSHGQSIQLRFEDFEKDGLAGASFELTEMVITGGVMKLTTRPHSASRST